jgi:hypothetical protein
MNSIDQRTSNKAARTITYKTIKSTWSLPRFPFTYTYSLNSKDPDRVPATRFLKFRTLWHSFSTSKTKLLLLFLGTHSLDPRQNCQTLTFILCKRINLVTKRSLY